MWPTPNVAAPPPRGHARAGRLKGGAERSGLRCVVFCLPLAQLSLALHSEDCRPPISAARTAQPRSSAHEPAPAGGAATAGPPGTLHRAPLPARPHPGPPAPSWRGRRGPSPPGTPTTPRRARQPADTQQHGRGGADLSRFWRCAPPGRAAWLRDERQTRVSCSNAPSPTPGPRCS